MNDLFNQPEVFFSQQNYPMQPTPCARGVHIEVPHGNLCYIPNFIDQKIADRTLAVFFENAQYDWKNTDWHLVGDINNVDWKNIYWHQDIIKMYGKSHALPRVSAWYGDTGKAYKYSGILLQPNPWNPALQWMKQQLATVCDTPFNSVLLNWYRSGQDYISWHTDAEKELGPNPTIASLNFGESRRFILRRNDDHDDKIEIRLGHGDLLIMQGALQHYWQHSVPKQTKITKGRLNMTFREIF